MIPIVKSYSLSTKLTYKILKRIHQICFDSDWHIFVSIKFVSSYIEFDIIERMRFNKSDRGFLFLSLIIILNYLRKCLLGVPYIYVQFKYWTMDFNNFNPYLKIVTIIWIIYQQNEISCYDSHGKYNITS